MDLLTDSRAYIRDVLALIHQYDPIHVKLYSYANTTLRAWALFYAADCTVAIGIHTISTVMRARRNRGGAAKAIRHWAKGAGLHVLRCSATLAAVSAGAALGSAIQPGPGTILGHFATDLAVSNTFFIVINSALA